MNVLIPFFLFIEHFCFFHLLKFHGEMKIKIFTKNFRKWILIFVIIFKNKFLSINIVLQNASELDNILFSLTHFVELR